MAYKNEHHRNLNKILWCSFNDIPIFINTSKDMTVFVSMLTWNYNFLLIYNHVTQYI